MSTIEPGPVWLSTRLTMTCGAGRIQSVGSTAQWIEVMPRLVAMLTVLAPQLPPGSRKYLIGASGTTAWIASLVLCISARIWSGERRRRLRSWDQVWLHRVWPSATIRRISAALAATWRPMTQNVALMWYWASRSSTWLVYGNGPSSKVSATASVPVVVSAPNGPWWPASMVVPDWVGVVGAFGPAGPEGVPAALGEPALGEPAVDGAGSGVPSSLGLGLWVATWAFTCWAGLACAGAQPPTRS